MGSRDEGLSQVMGFCTEAEHEEFLGSVSDFGSDPQIVFAYDISSLANGQLAK